LIFHGHEIALAAVAVSRDGTRIASVCHMGVVKVFDLTRGGGYTPQRSTNTLKLTSAAVADDGQTFATIEEGERHHLKSGTELGCAALSSFLVTRARSRASPFCRTPKSCW
jgi:hypothetical protein